MATLTVTAPDGKSLVVDIPQGTDPNTYSAIAEEVVQDYIQKNPSGAPMFPPGSIAAQNLAEMNGKGPLQDLNEMASVPEQGLQGIATLAKTGNIGKAGAVASGDEPGTGGAGGFVAGLLDPKYFVFGEILGPLLGRALGAIAEMGSDAIGTIASWLTPGQSTKLLAFIRNNPEFISYAEKLMQKSGSAVAPLIGSTEETLPALAKAGITDASGKAVSQPIGEIASGAVSDLKKATAQAKQVYETLGPDAFMERVQSILDKAPDAQSLGELDPADRGFLIGAYKYLQQSGAKSALTRLGYGFAISKLASLIPIFGPMLSGAAGIGEYALGNPAVSQGLQAALGRVAQGAATAAIPAATYAPSVLSGVSQGLAGGNQ